MTDAATVNGKKRVCVIGAGASGLAAVKELLEIGFTPVCFERDDKIGGLWYYTDKIRGENQGTGSYASLVTNSCKEMMCFTEYPFPKDYPPYLPWNLYLQYLNNFAEHFKLNEHIQLETSVLSVREASDFEETGKWVVVTKNKNGETQHLFDFVLICIGFAHKPLTPQVPGMEKFKGTIMHMHTYRKPDIFEGKRVMVVGNANSAGDVACDASRVATETFLSVGDGTWNATRIAKGGIPRDFMFRRVLMNVPSVLAAKGFKAECNAKIDHVNFGLASKKLPFHGAAIMLNDEIAYQIISGKVKVKGKVTEYTETGAVFDDGQVVDDLDLVVYATGYDPHFPFLDEKLLPEKEEDYNLYKLVFPVGRKHNTLAFVGAFLNFGAHAPAIELQARWTALIFSGKLALPSQVYMKEDVQKVKDKLKALYGQVKYKLAALPYREELAQEIGVRPYFWTIFKQNPKMAMKCFFGPAFPVQYRLVGPGAREWAWGATDRAWENTLNATKTRHIALPEQQRNVLLKFIFIIAVVGLLMALL